MLVMASRAMRFGQTTIDKTFINFDFRYRKTDKG